jgi:drug/metabolite transporter (DMT)-like permease
VRRRVWVSILAAALGFGTEGVLTRSALARGPGPHQIVMIRIVIAALASYVYLGVTRRIQIPDRVLLRQGFVQGSAHVAGPFLLLTVAFDNASAGFVALFTTLIPVTTAIAAHFALPDERFAPSLVTGFLVALGGVAVLIASGDSGLAVGGEPVLAATLALLAVFLIAASSVYAKRDAERYDPAQLTAFQTVVALIVVIAVSPIIGGTYANIDTETWGLLIFLAIGTTVIPYFAIYWAMQHATATLVSLVGYVIPFFAVLLGVVFLDEKLQAGIIFGGGLMLFGIALADRAERRIVVPHPRAS